MGFGDVLGLYGTDDLADGQNSVGRDSNTNRFFRLPGVIKGTRFVDLSFGNRNALYKVAAEGDFMKGTLWDGEAYARYSCSGAQ